MPYRELEFSISFFFVLLAICSLALAVICRSNEVILMRLASVVWEVWAVSLEPCGYNDFIR